MAHFTFIGGPSGPYTVLSQKSIKGEGLVNFERFGIYEGLKNEIDQEGVFKISGFTSNLRYASRSELTQLAKVQEGLGRPNSKLAACILLSKSPEWWALSQDERRQIFEEESHHTHVGLQYLPPVARRLHHSRDLLESFDFVTWFEYDEGFDKEFDQLVDKLRATKEWQYVNREYEIKLKKA